MNHFIGGITSGLGLVGCKVISQGNYLLRSVALKAEEMGYFGRKVQRSWAYCAWCFLESLSVFLRRGAMLPVSRSGSGNTWGHLPLVSSPIWVSQSKWLGTAGFLSKLNAVNPYGML